MGNRLHVAHKYVVEYGTYSNFNWKSAGFHNFLNAIEVEICGTDRTIDPCPWDFEIAREDWESGIECLKNFDSLIQEQQTEINDALKSLTVTLPDMIGIMEKYLLDADPEWDYLEFAFF